MAITQEELAKYLLGQANNMAPGAARVMPGPAPGEVLNSPPTPTMQPQSGAMALPGNYDPMASLDKIAKANAGLSDLEGERAAMAMLAPGEERRPGKGYQLANAVQKAIAAYGAYKLGQKTSNFKKTLAQEEANKAKYDIQQEQQDKAQKQQDRKTKLLVQAAEATEKQRKAKLEMDKLAQREAANKARLAAANVRLEKSIAAQERIAAQREKQAAMREERRNSKEKFKMDRALALNTGGVDASDTTKKAMVKLKTTMDEIGSTATELSPSMIDPTKSIILSISENVPIISGAMADALYNERDTKTKASVTGLVNNIRNALFGAAQSKGELFNFKPMDPLQPGIGISTARARMEALLKRFKSEYGNMKKIFPAVAYSLGDTDVPQGEWMKYVPQRPQQQQQMAPPPQQQMAPPPQQQMAPPQNTVDIGGVKYEIDPQTGDVYMVP